MMSTVDTCQKILCWLLDLKRLNRYILTVSSEFSRCKIVKMQAGHCWS